MSEKYCTVCGDPLYTLSAIAGGRCQKCFENGESPQPVPAAPETEQPEEPEGGEVPEVLKNLYDPSEIPIPPAIEKWFTNHSASYEDKHPSPGMGRAIFESGAYEMFQHLASENIQLQSIITALLKERDIYKERFDRAEKNIAALTEQVKAQ